MTFQPKHHTLLVCSLLASVVWLGCADEPVSVTGVALFAKGGNGGGVSVDATDPSMADQGTVGLDVRVFGSGFEPGSDVSFLLNRKETGDIATNSTQFVSDTELIANITVTESAAPELFDVRATTPRGRKGIGIELFLVTGRPQECQVNFDLTMNDAMPVSSDGLGTYSDGTDRVEASTGSGPGFRFDTNGNQKLEGRNDRRWVRFDFTGTAWEGVVAPDDLKGTDFRFSNQGPGLNLCPIGIGESRTVGANFPFEASDGTRTGLKYGGTTFSGNVCPAPPVTVTRTSQNTWDMASGASACIVRDGDILADNVAMPFAFTITAQGPVP